LCAVVLGRSDVALNVLAAASSFAVATREGLDILLGAIVRFAANILAVG
jgi:hypothetical protein